MARPKVALVTAGRLPADEVDEELPLLAAGLARRAEVQVVAWDDPTVDWAGFDLAVIRSTWDYPARLTEFLDWVAHCSARTRLANPSPVVRWNCDKHYLAALRTSGVPVVPTSYLPPGAPPVVPDDREFVVKPAVGGGAWQTARYQPADRAAALTHIERLHRLGSTALIQPYLSSVDTEGERSLIFLDGRFQHATRKAAVLVPGADPEQPRDAHPGLRRWSPEEAELDVARAALAAVPGGHRLLYARVDLIKDDTGGPVVSELELIEPSLFTELYPQSQEAFIDAIVRSATPGPVTVTAG